eukprot:CAMPEP_0119547314 /NCGR_PEP_ID=MMETSP1352-20130426/1455_1 /TAXON_ID=265584 /ORGANISM="Stauroneis constricta, Strain CCMP1120" /LENGTH=120 /DNA_ID=CAMNT_0007592193 /DNA_START=38 /DNA_END=400 /DNA_ORIENTATION=-
MVFFFATSSHDHKVLEAAVGNCQFCDAKDVDLVELRTQWHIMGCIPMQEQVDQIVLCKSCKNYCKASYFTKWNVPRKMAMAKKEEVDAPAASNVDIGDDGDDDADQKNSLKVPLLDASVA